MNLFEGIASDALDKLRGRSRSGLPSPESEDISRRRDTRKEKQTLPVSGLTSLARLYADDVEKEEANAKVPAEETGEEETSSAAAAAVEKTNAAVAADKDDQEPEKSLIKDDKDKDKDKDKDVGHQSGKDKQTVNFLV